MISKSGATNRKNLNFCEYKLRGSQNPNLLKSKNMVLSFEDDLEEIFLEFSKKDSSFNYLYNLLANTKDTFSLVIYSKKEKKQRVFPIKIEGFSYKENKSLTKENAEGSIWINSFNQEKDEWLGDFLTKIIKKEINSEDFTMRIFKRTKK